MHHQSSVPCAAEKIDSKSSMAPNMLLDLKKWEKWNAFDEVILFCLIWLIQWIPKEAPKIPRSTEEKRTK